MLLFTWLRRPDSNRRPLGYEPNELPTAPLRDIYSFSNPLQRYRFFSEKTNFLCNIFSMLLHKRLWTPVQGVFLT